MFLLFPPPVKSNAYSVQEELQPVQPSAEELLEVKVTNVVHAIYGAEGRCDFLHGGSGEYGCYQYLPSTWKAYSTIVAGEVLVQTDENEVFITKGMVRKWLTEGKSPRWIFLEWNQGKGDGWGPGTKDCYAGVNKHGVAYDSCDYAARATAFFLKAQTL